MKYINIDSLYDFPIQFKQLNHSDFQNYIFEEDKTIIEPDEDGYISDELRRIIDLDKKDTTVINAGVGQGKTTAIVNIILDYYAQNISEQGNYKIIIITPFKHLNFQYVEKIVELGGQNDIYFDYQDINTKAWDEGEAILNSKKPIQLISVKSILGDPGEEGFEQNENKRRYYDYLINQCEQNNEKVILFFDEIHESLDSFTPKLLPFLFKWKPVTQKIYVASATFSESSIPAIKFFAELTEKKIRIIEGERTQKENVSELFLCFYNRPTIVVDDFYFTDLFAEILSKNYSGINILTSVPGIAEQIYESNIGNMIRERFQNFNLSIGKNKKFNKVESNIGTTFKTGISIEKQNTAFVVILPSLYAQSQNENGIFTDKINSLVQSLARPRSSTSSIYIITSPPRKLILREENDSDYIEKLSLGYLDFSGKEKQSIFIDINHQDNILRRHYKSTKKHIETEIEMMKNLNEEIRSLFRSYDWFKIQEGNRFLTTRYDIFGKNLSNYLYWAAWNNQFVNCKLKAIIKKDYLVFTEGNILKELDGYVPLDMINSETFYTKSDKEIFENLFAYLYSDNIYYQKAGEESSIKITPSRMPTFNHQIIRFLQRRKTPYLFQSNDLEDKSINKEKFLQVCISQCEYILGKDENFSDDEKLIIGAYNDLYLFRDILLNEYAIRHNNKLLLPKDNDFKFKTLHSIKLKNAFLILKEKDLSFNFFGTQSLFDDKSMYSLLRKIFFKTSETIFSGRRCLKIQEVIPIEYSDYKLNLVYNVPEPHVHFPYPPEDTINYEVQIIEDENGEIIENEEGYISIRVNPLDDNELE